MSNTNSAKYYRAWHSATTLGHGAINFQCDGNSISVKNLSTKSIYSRVDLDLPFGRRLTHCTRPTVSRDTRTPENV